ncbi:DUF397 domain-containing protein [Actinoplanes sp. LDG1-06]|uniref:DUF397 domain-containing protein n=1 Tax=Paractinoplanes ovalisporus TaxID=2810368 RepID=A0ABS2A4U8_9ACTN|nr:DUF397 domain-containing protein [Actinoplanes ovalisporus]MBM2614318.1 DUF397 domain-containing protein [Actinoplanes ovalisporus]
MHRPDFRSARWRKSISSSETNCVEVALVDGFIGVRDSKDPFGPVLAFTRSEWAAFLTGVRGDEFELEELGHRPL